MLLLHSQSFVHYGLDRFFAFAEKAGIPGVEISLNDNLDTQSPEYLKSLETKYNVRIKAFSMPLKWEDKMFEVFQNVVKEFPETTIHLSPPSSLSFQYKKWTERIVPQLASKYGIHVRYRNVPLQSLFGILPDRTGNSLFSLRDTGHVCLDLSALWSSKQEIMRSMGILGGSLEAVYLSNVNRSVPYSRLENGVLPLESFLSKLAKNRFTGDIVLMLSPRAISEGKDEKVLETIRESKEFVMKYLKG